MKDFEEAPGQEAPSHPAVEAEAVSLKLWLIQQSANDGYDTFDSAVVAAADEEAASRLSPSGDVWIEGKGWCWDGKPTSYPAKDWTFPANVTVKLIGEALPSTKPGVICASFNAG